MDLELLKRLYTALSDETPIFKKGFNLCELWHRIEDTEIADRDFVKTLDDAKLPFHTADSFTEASAASNIAYEFQGFVNGFCLAMRMATGKNGVA